MQIYVVKPGDTLYSIGRALSLAPGFLARYNGLREPYRLAVGQSLLVLYPERTVTVRAGDALSSIAASSGTDVLSLFRMNPNLSGSDQLYPGQVLVTQLEQSRTRSAFVGGYAYPYVQESVLRGILPFAGALMPFTYGFTPEGALMPMDDERLLALAGEYGVRPFLHLSTLTAAGTFSAAQAAVVLRSEALQQTLAEAVLQKMQEKGYMGLDVDFEYVYPDDAGAYAAFLATLARRLNPLGYPVIAALAPKTSSTQRGALYEGHDYSAIGAAVNEVLLMTYEWGYTYGPPMAVAPISNVRQVVEYALTVIPAEKIWLGVPNYGYDWLLPFVKGKSKATSLSSQQAVALARRYGAEIAYDDLSQSPWFRYTDESGGEHEVWFEDARSIQAKLALIPEYGLLGAGYWNLMRPFPQNWRVLSSLYQIRKSPS